MSVVAREHVGSRPFARTVYVIAARRFTGDLVLTQDGATYKVTWREGKVVAAHSPSPADMPGRIALTAGLVTSTQVADALRRAPAEQSQLAMLAEVAKLTAEQVLEIKRRTVVHQALRIFALEQASIVIDNEPSLPPQPDVPALAGRWVVYHGLRMHYTEERLVAEMARAKSVRLRLNAAARGHLDELGFSPADRRCLDRIGERMSEAGLTLDEMAAACPEMPRKVVLAIIYALLATDALAPAGPGKRAPVYTPAHGVATIPMRDPAHTPARGVSILPTRSVSATPAQGSATIPARPAPAPAARPATRPAPARPAPAAAPRSGSRSVRISSPSGSSPRASSQSGPTPPPPGADEIRALIKAKLDELDEGADYFHFLGVSQKSNDNEIRNAYFDLARKLHPDRLRAAGVTDMPAESQRLFSQINQAFNTIGTAKKRARYVEAMRITSGGDGKGTQEDVKAYAARIMGAEEHFLRGEMALRRQRWQEALAEFQKAVELNPDEAEHHALLGWAIWCAADDKDAVLAKVKGMLSRALTMSPNNFRAVFFRGRLASVRGEYRAALDDFRQVLKLNPDHQEAALEARLLQGRLQKRDAKDKGKDKGGGLFTRRKRR